MGQCGSVEGPVAGPSEHRIALNLRTKKSARVSRNTVRFSNMVVFR